MVVGYISRKAGVFVLYVAYITDGEKSARSSFEVARFDFDSPSLKKETRREV
jgi:hypothetical protein